MEWFLWSLVIVILGLAAVAGSGRFGSLPDPVRDMPNPELPDGPLSADDLRGVQFAVVARGYSMTQVDALLDRLAVQLDADRPVTVGPPEPSAIMDQDENEPGDRPDRPTEGQEPTPDSRGV